MIADHDRDPDAIRADLWRDRFHAMESERDRLKYENEVLATELRRVNVENIRLRQDVFSLRNRRTS